MIHIAVKNDMHNHISQMFWNWNIQPPSSDLDEQNDADMFWMGNLGARKWDRKKTSSYIPKKGVCMKIRVSQKPLVYDHFPHFQIALSPSFSHTMVHISMSVDPKFLHVPSWEQTLQKHKRFWGKKTHIWWVVWSIFYFP